MTEDFASDMYLLRDLLLLARCQKKDHDSAYAELHATLGRLESKATTLMVAVQHLKRAYNPANRELMMGLWAAEFVDPVDPPNGQQPEIDDKLSEADLIARAKEAGRLLNDLFDDLKSPHRVAGDKLPQADDLRRQITGVRQLVESDLQGEFWQLRRNLDCLVAAFQKMGGAGGESTYWPSQYVSSSSSSSSSSGYP
ncbi:MAG: hypothetical protein ACKV19_13670 [Verrucomicrobiales bacterium]